MMELVVIPDPDPADAVGVTDNRDPRVLAAAEQMCTVDGTKDPTPALYNYDGLCNVEAAEQTPDPKDPNNEAKPKSQKAGVDVNTTVIF